MDIDDNYNYLAVNNWKPYEWSVQRKMERASGKGSQSVKLERRKARKIRSPQQPKSVIEQKQVVDLCSESSSHDDAVKTEAETKQSVPTHPQSQPRSLTQSQPRSLTQSQPRTLTQSSKMESTNVSQFAQSFAQPQPVNITLSNPFAAQHAMDVSPSAEPGSLPVPFSQSFTAVKQETAQGQIPLQSHHQPQHESMETEQSNDDAQNE